MNEEQLREFAESRVGSVLCEKWTLERLLGVGGTASVYSATHRNGKRVAVKILHAELSRQQQFRDRFLREGYVGNHIEHAGAITVHDDGETEDGCVLLVMDLLEGENLESRRERKGGRLDSLEVLSLVDDILDTLAAAHERGVVHRDIKPENLFLTKENQVKLLDFGIARIDVADDPGKTLAGIAMGTPAFMPPEQASARWEEVGGQSDLWALGASMFTLLTGRYVHEGGTVNESLAMAVTRAAPPLQSIDPAIPLGVCAIVNKALSRDQSLRWADAAEMQIAVRQAYKDLQNLPEGERYSLSHGSVSYHSAPPVAANNAATTGVLTGDPVSTSLIAITGSGSRKKAIGVALGLGLLMALVAVVGAGTPPVRKSRRLWGNLRSRSLPNRSPNYSLGNRLSFRTRKAYPQPTPKKKISKAPRALAARTKAIGSVLPVDPHLPLPKTPSIRLPIAIESLAL